MCRGSHGRKWQVNITVYFVHLKMHICCCSYTFCRILLKKGYLKILKLWATQSNYCFLSGRRLLSGDHEANKEAMEAFKNRDNDLGLNRWIITCGVYLVFLCGTSVVKLQSCFSSEHLVSMVSGKICMVYYAPCQRLMNFVKSLAVYQYNVRSMIINLLADSPKYPIWVTCHASMLTCRNPLIW